VYFFFIKLLIHFKFFLWPQFISLDNPVPDPVEEETISKPIRIQKIPNIRPDWTTKPGSCTPLVSTSNRANLLVPN